MLSASIVPLAGENRIVSRRILLFVELKSSLPVILVGLQVVRNAVSSMPLTDTLSEPQLLRLAVDGDEEAFAALYGRLKSMCIALPCT